MWLPVLLIFLLLLWLWPVVRLWAAPPPMPDTRSLFVAVWLIPLVLFDDLLLAFDGQGQWAFAVALFDLAPAIIGLMLLRTVHRMVLTRPWQWKWYHIAPLIILLLLEVPTLFLSGEQKVLLLQDGAMAGLGLYWGLFAQSLLVQLYLLVLAVQIEILLKDYQENLSEQVVDVGFYQMPGAIGLFTGLITLSFGAILVVMLVAFDLLYFPQWMSAIALSQAVLFIGLFLVLMHPSRYSPCPIDYQQVHSTDFPQDFLAATLSKAEQAMIQGKAYKTIGLRLSHFARAANVEPLALAAATHKLLNRNFRAFVYHYRLEYAKKVLMSSDARVSAVAKRLGFNSEKFLSDAFIKYIGTMGRSERLSEHLD